MFLRRTIYGVATMVIVSSVVLLLQRRLNNKKQHGHLRPDRKL